MGEQGGWSWMVGDPETSDMGCHSNGPPCLAFYPIRYGQCLWHRESRAYKIGQLSLNLTLSFALSCGEWRFRCSSDILWELCGRPRHQRNRDFQNWALWNGDLRNRALRTGALWCRAKEGKAEDSYGHHHHPDNFASFTTYFPRLLRQVYPGLNLSHEAMNVMDLFVKDIFEWIAAEARHLASSNKHGTITSGEIQMLCVFSCLRRFASTPCLRPPSQSSDTTAANKLPQDHLNITNSTLFKTTHLEGKDL